MKYRYDIFFEVFGVRKGQWGWRQKFHRFPVASHHVVGQEGTIDLNWNVSIKDVDYVLSRMKVHDGKVRMIARLNQFDGTIGDYIPVAGDDPRHKSVFLPLQRTFSVDKVELGTTV